MKNINIMDINVGDMISEFTDDTKIGCVMDSEEGCLRLVQDLDQRQSWMNSVGRWNVILRSARLYGHVFLVK